eukprot:344076-Pyramimonas_sp.AAC.1
MKNGVLRLAAKRAELLLHRHLAPESGRSLSCPAAVARQASDGAALQRRILARLSLGLHNIKASPAPSFPNLVSRRDLEEPDDGLLENALEELGADESEHDVDTSAVTKHSKTWHSPPKSFNGKEQGPNGAAHRTPFRRLPVGALEDSGPGFPQVRERN